MPLPTPPADSPQMGDSCPPSCSASSEYDRLKARKNMLIAAETAVITKPLREENARLRSLLAQAMLAMPESVRDASREDLVEALLDAETEDVVRDTAQFMLEARKELSETNADVEPPKQKR